MKKIKLSMAAVALFLTLAGTLGAQVVQSKATPESCVRDSDGMTIDSSACPGSLNNCCHTSTHEYKKDS